MNCWYSVINVIWNHTGFLQICLHCHRQWVHSTQYTRGVSPNVIFTMSLSVHHVSNILVQNKLCCVFKHTQPLCTITTDMTAATGCMGGFEADCPGQSYWWSRRPVCSCPIWLEGRLQPTRYSYSEILSCWSVAVAEPHEPEDLSVGSAWEETER